MANSLGPEITEILRAWRAGSDQALDHLTPEIYRELQCAARQCMRHERDGHTLQTTALINELYLRLPDLQDIDWQGRAHFFRDLRSANAAHSHRHGACSTVA